MPGSRGGEGSDARIPRGRGFRCPDPEGEREGFRCSDPDGKGEGVQMPES